MTTQTETQTPAPPAHAQLIEMSMGFVISRIIYAAADLGLADHLAEGPRSAEQLAGPTGTHAPTLHRLMRTLTGLGVLTRVENRRFALTPLGEALRSGAEGAARPTILALNDHYSWRAWGEFMNCLKDGESGIEKAWGKPLFDLLAEHPEKATLFNQAMIGFHGAEPPAIAAAYDFSELGVVVDVGGGTGNLLTTILTRHPGPDGILFDRSHVVKEARHLIEERGLTDRIKTESGSFFEAVPTGGDAYILSHIIHDWNEDQCLTILNNCRQALKPDGRLLIVEMVLPSDDTPHPGKLTDMVMLVMPGGEERTEEGYSILLKKAGFRLNRVVPTDSAVSVVEAVLE